MKYNILNAGTAVNGLFRSRGGSTSVFQGTFSVPGLWRLVMAVVTMYFEYLRGDIQIMRCISLLFDTMCVKYVFGFAAFVTSVIH
jgi:hypothetical protein